MDILKIAEQTIIHEAEVLATKFVLKVESGQARSVETYSDCKFLLELIKTYKKNKEKTLATPRP